MNDKLGQIFTQRRVAEYMVDLLDCPVDGRILDPCFGGGVFLDCLYEKGYRNITGIEIDKSLFEDYKLHREDMELYNEDFLTFFGSAAYDAVIMNPPYIRHEKINELKSYGITKGKLFRQKIFADLPKTSNLYMFFIVKAIHLLKENGTIVVIFPESWIKARVGRGFLECVSSVCSIEKSILVKGNAFESNAYVDVVIWKLKKLKGEWGQQRLEIYVDHDNIREKKLEAEGSTFTNMVPFDRYATIRRGLTTGANSVFINPALSPWQREKYTCRIISSPKQLRGYSTEGADCHRLLRVCQEDLRQDKALAEYMNRKRQEIVKRKTPKTLYDAARRQLSWYQLKTFDCRGIWFSYFVRNDMKFIYNDSDVIARDNFYVIYSKIDPLLLFSLLNNYYVFCQLEGLGKRYGKGLLKLQKYDLEELMLFDIEKISHKDRSMLRELAGRLIVTGEGKLVSEITEILAKYHSHREFCAEEQWRSMKTNRLEADNG